MKKIFAAMVASLLMVALVSSTAMAAAPLNYKTFGSATVTQSSPGTWTIVSDGLDPVYTTSPEYGGIYISGKNLKNELIGQVDFSFTSSGAVAGGAPRFSIPIDTDGNGSANFYAFLDAAGCGGVADLPMAVSTASTTCAVNAGPESFPNWAAFVAAHPAYRTAPNAVPFIIADGTQGTYVVSNINLR